MTPLEASFPLPPPFPYAPVHLPSLPPTALFWHIVLQTLAEQIIGLNFCLTSTKRLSTALSKHNTALLPSLQPPHHIPGQHKTSYFSRARSLPYDNFPFHYILPSSHPLTHPPVYI